DERAGTISNRRVFVSTDEAHGYPDGLAVDTAGNVWSACFGGSCLCKYDPMGQLVERVALPVSCPTAIAFGDAGAGMAFVTTSTFALAGGRNELHAGSLLKVALAVDGRPAAIFGAGAIR